MNAVVGGHAQTERRNYAHLVYDIAWFGLALAATSRFLSVYAIRLGATPIDLGWIAALPALMLLIFSSFAVWWLHHFKSTRAALMLPGFAFRLLFLLPMFAPLLPPRWRPLWLIIGASLPAIGQGIAGVIFIIQLRQVIPDTRMASLMGRRSLALNISVAIGALGFGLLLEQVAFPLNYQLMFGIAFLFAMVSWWHVWRLRVLSPTATDVVPVAPLQPRTNPWRNANFRSVALITGILHLAFFAIAPIIPLFLVRRLDATEGFMAVFGMMELVGGALFSILAPRLIQRFGTRSVMALAMVATGFSALIIAWAPSLTVTLIAAALSGAAWTAAASVGLMSYFMERTPNGETESYSVAFHQAIGLTMFIGPMIGSALANNGADLVSILVLGAGVRFVAGLLLSPHIRLRRAADNASIVPGNGGI